MSNSTIPSITVCKFEEQSEVAYGVGSFLVIGVIVAYLPQIILLIQKKTSLGLSWMSVFLSCVCTSTNTLNAVFLDWDTIMCVPEYGFFKALGSLLPIIQIAVGWINCTIVFALLLYYFPRQTPLLTRSTIIDGDGDGNLYDDEDDEDAEQLVDKPLSQTLKKSSHPAAQKPYAMGAFVFYVAVILIMGTFTGILLTFTVGSSSKIFQSYAFALGVVSSFSVIFQWAPQIYQTWKLKDPGSLSIAMLLMKAPGAFLVVFFQAILYHKSISTWGSFLLDGLQQVILLVMCFAFEVQKRMRSKESLHLQESSLRFSRRKMMQDETQEPLLMFIE